MSRSAPGALDSASKYQSLFNSTNGLWSGAEKLISVRLPDTSVLWISGLCWSGPVASGGATRSGNTHTNFSSLIFQGSATLNTVQPTINDTSNNRYFTLDSFPITKSKFGRLDPVAAYVRGNRLYISCHYSTTDYLSWALSVGPMYLIVLDVSSTTNHTFPIIDVVQLPVFTIAGGYSVYFGSTLNGTKDYLYVGGQQNVPSTTTYYHYLGRIPWIYIKEPTKWEYILSSKWSNTTDPSKLSYIVSCNTPEICLWKESNTFFLMAQSLTSPGNIRVYSSSTIGQKYTDTGINIAQTARPSGGWSNGAFIARHARLASGKRLGYYTNGIANDTYDNANPLYKRPTFFEF